MPLYSCRAASEFGGRKRIKESWKAAFLRSDWFPATNPAALRTYIKREALALMVQLSSSESLHEILPAVDFAVSEIEEIDCMTQQNPNKIYLVPEPFAMQPQSATAVPEDSDSDDIIDCVD